VAQDFYALFGLGANDTSISTIDPAGVALVGIQGLNRKFEQLTVTLATQQVPLPVTSPAPTATAGPMGESTEVKSLSVIEQIQAKGGIIAWASSLFKESVVFEKIATFMSDVVFKGRAKFEQAPEFGQDTAGVAVIKQGADKVAVTFAHGYDRAPQVSATMIAADTNVEAAVFEQDVRFVVTHISAHGFEIKLNKAAPQDISFSWIVVDVAEPTTSVGKEQVVKEVEIVEPSPEIQLPEPTTSPSARPEASPSQLPPITPDRTELPLATESADVQ
jgi:hypothetical protein